MYLDLSRNEIEELQRALDQHLRRLMDELVHTDDRTYATGLRSTIEVLENIEHALHGKTENGQAFTEDVLSDAT